MQSIKIEMIHDVVCSWCAIGYCHLQTALKQLESEVYAELSFLPFELNPALGPEGEMIEPHLQRRLGWSAEQIAAYRQDLIPRARAAGVNIDFTKRTHYYNTFGTHCLMHWAHGQNMQVSFNDVLVEAYHTEGANLGNREKLLDLVARAGMDRDAADRALRSGDLIDPVRQKMARVAGFPVKTVPAFVFNDDIFVSGSNSAEYFRDLLLNLSHNTSSAADAA